jgi:hypothetical protein
MCFGLCFGFNLGWEFKFKISKIILICTYALVRCLYLTLMTCGRKLRPKIIVNLFVGFNVDKLG